MSAFRPFPDSPSSLLAVVIPRDGRTSDVGEEELPALGGAAGEEGGGPDGPEAPHPHRPRQQVPEPGGPPRRMEERMGVRSQMRWGCDGVQMGVLGARSNFPITQVSVISPSR